MSTAANACTIVQLTDLHVRPRGMAANRVAETNALAVRAFRAVRQLEPAADAVIVTGDLTENGLVAEYAELRFLLETEMRRPVFAVPGNHDRREVMLRELSSVAAAADGFVQYVVDTLPVRIVMLDTVVPGAGYGLLCERRLAWLEATLAAMPDKPTLIGMHHPPFVCGLRHMDEIALQEPAKFVEIISRHRQVVRIVCGHHHRPIVGQVAGVVTTVCTSAAHQVELDLSDRRHGAFVLEPPSYQIHRWTAETGMVTHTAFVERFPGPFPFLDDPDYPGREKTSAAAPH